jgi:hypothetical protein
MVEVALHTGGRGGLNKIVFVPWKAGRRWRARTRVVAACETSFQSQKKKNKDAGPGRLLSTQSSQFPADAQPIATEVWPLIGPLI